MANIPQPCLVDYRWLCRMSEPHTVDAFGVSRLTTGQRKRKNPFVSLEATEAQPTSSSSEGSTQDMEESQAPGSPIPPLKYPPMVPRKRRRLPICKDTSSSESESDLPKLRLSPASPERISSPVERMPLPSTTSRTVPKKTKNLSPLDNLVQAAATLEARPPGSCMNVRLPLQRQAILMMSLLESACAAERNCVASVTRPDGSDPNLSFVRLNLRCGAGKAVWSSTCGSQFIPAMSLCSSIRLAVLEKARSVTGCTFTTELGVRVLEVPLPEDDQWSRFSIQVEAWIWQGSSFLAPYFYWIALERAWTTFPGPQLKRSRMASLQAPSLTVSTSECPDPTSCCSSTPPFQKE